MSFLEGNDPDKTVDWRGGQQDQGVVSRDMEHKSLKREPLWTLYVGLVIALAVTIGFAFGNIQSIREGQFTEGSGPGGHAIGTVTVAGNPLKFWGDILFTSCVSIFMLILTVVEIYRGHRERRRHAK